MRGAINNMKILFHENADTLTRETKLGEKINYVLYLTTKEGLEN